MGICCADHVTTSVRKKLALTSPTSGGRLVGIVRSWTKAMEFSFSFIGKTRIKHATVGFHGIQDWQHQVSAVET
jgi:hypothetical protein